MTLLWKLLRSHLSFAQTFGFALAGVVGMTVVLASMQAYRDVLPLFEAPDSFAKGDFLVLSKQVGTLNSLGMGSTDFSSGELDELASQPFVRSIGAFTPADYRVTGSVGMGGIGFSTSSSSRCPTASSMWTARRGTTSPAAATSRLSYRATI
mgnify:CR=1 FL=1